MIIMSLKEDKRKKIKSYIVESVTTVPDRIAQYTAEKFDISRQTVNRYINELIDQEEIKAIGRGRGRTYKLVEKEHKITIKDLKNADETKIWLKQIKTMLPTITKQVEEICGYGVTEMINNSIDHSESQTCEITISYDSIKLTLAIKDFGIGIFKKIQDHFHLDDPRQSILELAKGKLTSDPDNHSGEGIFFTSRMFDEFYIFSGNLCFFGNKNKDCIVETPAGVDGTMVCMEINRKRKKKMEDIFEEYETGDGEFGFSKTMIPVTLLQHEGELLISRSQAKRLIVRFEKFKEVILDFEGIIKIGQGFADEVFRVFRRKHPETKLFPINTNTLIDKMIKHVLNSNL